MSEERDRLGWIPGRPGSRKPKEMALYIITEIGSDKPCKIGYAADTGRRMFTLGCGNPRELLLRFRKVIPWPQDESWMAYVERVQGMEKELHKVFAGARVRGEWFDVEWSLIQEAMSDVPRQT